MSAVNDPVSGRRRRESLIRSIDIRAAGDGQFEFRRPSRLVVPTTFAHSKWMRIVCIELERD